MESSPRNGRGMERHASDACDISVIYKVRTCRGKPLFVNGLLTRT